MWGGHLEADVWTLCTDCTPASTMDEALEVIRAFGEGKWKWNKPTGNCTTNAQLRCNAHVGCPVVMKTQLEGAEFKFYKRGIHGQESNVKKRKNSALTFDEEADARLALDMGGRPGKLYCALTLKELGRVKEAGESVEEAKDDNGGMKGVMQALPWHEYTSNTCIMYVSEMYQDCIIVGYMYPNVSGMYPGMYPDLEV